MWSNELEGSVFCTTCSDFEWALSDVVSVELERISLQEIRGIVIRATLKILNNGLMPRLMSGLMRLNSECFKIVCLIVIFRGMTVLLSDKQNFY